MFKKLITLFLILTALLTLTVIPASAEKNAPAEKLSITLSGTGYSNFGFLRDGNIKAYKSSNATAAITVESAEEMYSLYLMFD